MTIKKVIIFSVCVLFFLVSCSDPSSSIEKIAIPLAPTGLSASATSGTGITLTWTDNADNEENYVVERSEDGGVVFATLTDTLAVDSESYDDTSFVPTEDHNFTYRVYATNSAGDSGNDEVSVLYDYTAPVTVPDAPTGLSASATSGTGVTLTWTDNADNEENYVVERSEDGGSFTTLVDTLAADSESYNDTSFVLTEDHNFTYSVHAVNSAGDSGSIETSVAYTAPVTAPDAPTGLSAVATSGTGVSLTWTDTADNEENYIVERSDDGGIFSTLVDNLAADSESYDDTSFVLTEDHSFTYRVHAVNSAGESGSIDANVNYSSPPAVPAAPSGLNGGTPSGVVISLNLTWTDNADDEENYVVQRSEDGGSFTTLSGSLIADSTSYNDTAFTLTEDHNFTYRVYASNSNGNSDYAETTVSYTVPATSYLIINHESIAEFDTLTPTQISEAKKALIIIAGLSHGRAYGYGLELLEADDSNFDAEVNWDGAAEFYTDQHLRYNQYYRFGTVWEHYAGEEQFYTSETARDNIIAGLNYIDTTYSGLIIFGFGWCWDMSWMNSPSGYADPVYGVRWAGSSEGGPDDNTIWGLDADDFGLTGNSVSLQTYLDAVETYNNQNLNNVITIYTTGPVDGDYTYSLASLVKGEYEGAYQRYLKNRAIRAYVIQYGGILFDFADILSWQDGVQYTTSWTDPDTGAEHVFPYGDPDLASGGSGYSGADGVSHTSADGCLLLGKALWVLAVKAGEWTP